MNHDRASFLRWAPIALVLLAACGSPPPKSSAPSAEPPMTFDRNVQGTVLDNEGKAFIGRVVLDRFGSQTARSIGADGRFVIARVGVGKHTLSLTVGNDDQFVRRTLDEGIRTLSVPIEVTFGREPLSVGTLYGESNAQNNERAAKIFGPYCALALAGKPLTVPPERMPVRLERTGRDAWMFDDVFEPKQLGSVAAVCKLITRKESGVYSISRMPASDYTWQVVVALRDGRTLRQTFKAPAPQAAMGNGLGVVETGQTRKLEEESRAWLATAVPKT